MTQRERTIRSGAIVGIGQILELSEPYPDTPHRWIVVGIEPDPAAIWSLQYDEGDLEPEASPDTVLLRLRSVA